MSSSVPDFEALLVPMQLDAFVLNPAVCGTGAENDTTAHICPITQPNYTFLRLDSFVLQSDVQNHADVHNTAPASINPRLTDLGGIPEPQPLRHRHGVYIHWTLPRFYRSGVSSGESVPESRRRYERGRRGLDAAAPRSGQTGSNDTPDFVDPPTRWIVVRKLDVNSVRPAEAKADFANREYEAWVVESDYLWSLEDIPIEKDLQTDLAPFVTGHAGGDINIEEQAEVFIGRKTPLASWSGQEDPNAQPPSISLLRSGNQLFADFQMHNSNVFSVLDNFEYGSQKEPKYLSYAKASYYVFGWHWSQDADPLWKSGQTVTHGGSLDSLFMTLKGVAQDDAWQEATSQLRIMCHGAMYDVTWDHENKPAQVPADQYNARLRDQVQAAVSVGTTPMDSLLSYCHARRDQAGRPGDIEKLEEDILALESLLLARDDGVEGQREAKDSVYNWSFTRSPGGTRYFFSEPNGNDQGGTKQPLEPDTASKLKLRELNQTQSVLDACNMTVMQYRWDMFSLWWKYLSDLENQTAQGNQDINGQAARISSRITALQSRIQTLQQMVDGLLHPPAGTVNLLANANTASVPVFYRANDPTVLIGGIPSGWPDDYLDKVSVRAPFHMLAPGSGSALPDALSRLNSLVQDKLPAVFKAPATGLVTEFYLLRPGGGDSGTAPEGKFYPQFHDQLNSDERWRDQWGDRQPWFPLFAEWEIEYRHIPFDYWKLDEHTARLSADELVRYGISVPPKDGQVLPLWQAILKDQTGGQADVRVLSGRVLILPQPSFSLGAKITQLFTNTPPDVLDQYLPGADRNNLLKNITQLSFLSSPLSGMTSGLLTQAEGSHIKPENKVVGPSGETSSVLAAAVVGAAGLTADRIGLVQGNSALTPYSTLTNFADLEYCPFKPVTHGQFRFRKLNIIDKFGQALVAIDQNPRIQGPPPMYPCISDFYEPQTVELDDGKTYANTVLQDNTDQCEFLQLPPQINQNVRLNSEFVKRIADDTADVRKRFKTGGSPDSAKWRPATEWEMPIWGWVIINYADYGIQIFLPDGTFYREVRFGGPLGTLESPKWLPFSPNDSPPTPDTRQLDALVTKLLDPEYLNGFWFMITTAQNKLPPAPSAYAQFLNSIVGKPMALVNTGWSLELDGPPLEIQSKKGKVNEPERLLTPPTDSSDEKPYYQFQVRLGNRDAGYDGLVGYFDTTAPGSDELNLDVIRTFFAPEKDDMKPLKRLGTDSYPRFTPFWEQPMAVDNNNQPIEPEAFVDGRNARMSIYGAIVDPFTPVHAYSSILPPTPLSLAPWTWQKAMDTMTAFFHAGPLTLPIDDVPSYDASQRLTTQNAREIPKRDLPLPSLGAGDWNWFQPYPEAVSGASGEGEGQATFNPFGIEKRGDLNKPAFQDGPYVAIEGFLQLRNPIMMPKGS